ncbi:hypothetical protein [Archangium lansingense]|uniref:Uncharacterized protein n=1 Tax=Archangium lansingense TaxID=2995310 RepID=A0ABT4A682_9BACT|nr:hypothetical protein [Archangium lansinium]MCY1077096.1 hypothetical protein [Archangium lansinium]
MSESRSIWRDGRNALALVLRSPLSLFILFNLTFVTALLLLQGTGLQGLAYLRSDRSQFWHMIIALTPTAWVTSLFLLLGDFGSYRSAWPRTRWGRMAVVLCLVPLLLLIALPLVAQFFFWRESPRLLTTVLLPMVPDFIPKLVSVCILGLLIATLHASAMVGLHIQLLGRLPKYQHLGEPPGAESLNEDVLWYQRHQRQLRRLLRLVSTILGLSILSVGALRNLINSAITSPAELLSTAPVMSYGLYYTGIIASLYVPAHRTLKDVGQVLAERLVWQTLGTHPTWKQRFEEQQAVRTQLGLRDSALHELQQGLSVLAPFLASISSLAIGSGG